MTRIDEIRERLDKARPGLGEIDGGEELQKRRGNPKGSYTWTLYGTYADAVMFVHAREDIAYLLDALARRDQRCEYLAVSLDEMRRDLLHAERSEQEVTDVLHTVHAMCLHGDPQQQIAEYIEQQDPGYQATKKEN